MAKSGKRNRGARTKIDEGFYRAVAEYYDAEYARYRILQNDLPFFMGYAGPKSTRLLEIGAGSGRAAIPLAEAGHRVVGIDNDPAMLEIARRKAAFIGLGAKNLTLIEADATRLELGMKFDWVCVFFNTMLNFSTLEQLDGFLAGVRAHLRPGGRFWFDLFNPDLQLLARPREHASDPEIFHVPEMNRTVLRETKIRVEAEKQLQHVTFTYRWFDDAGKERVNKRTFRATWLFPREMQLLLERHGMKFEEMWGNYDGSALRADSPRIIGVARAK